MVFAVAVAAQQAVSFIGMPEGRIPLAEATIFLASAPKSNSAYLAIDKALGLVRQSRDEPVPMHLRNAPTRLMGEHGIRQGLPIPHTTRRGIFKPSENLPEAVKDNRFYTPGEFGCGDGRLWSDYSTGGGRRGMVGREIRGRRKTLSLDGQAGVEGYGMGACDIAEQSRQMGLDRLGVLARQSRQNASMPSWQLWDVMNRFSAVVIAWCSAKVVADVGDRGDRESRCGDGVRDWMGFWVLWMMWGTIVCMPIAKFCMCKR